MKKILAVAIASAFAAPAFAATANVDVYGKLHVSVSSFSDQPAATSDTQISSNASRIGFKGAEDLGGGMSAIWQIESTVGLDEQASTAANGFATRNSFVGLKSGLGTVLVGRHDTPLKLVGRAVDLFGDTMADSRNVLTGASDTRANNVVAYISPNFSGFGVAVAYVSDFPGAMSTAGDVVDTSVYNLNATYTNGPLFLGVGYGDGDGHTAAGFDTQWRAAAGFTMGDLKFVGQYDSLEDATPLAGTGDFTGWMLGASYTMGNIVLKANYMEGDFDLAAAADRQQWTIGADYNLSKRTAVYALYAAGENITIGSGAGTSDQIAGAVVAGDDEVSVISLGLTHTF